MANLLQGLMNVAQAGGASAKNLAISPGASELGLGDMLKQQVEDQVDDRKKKLLQPDQQTDRQNMAGMALTPGVASLMTGTIKGVA